MIEELTNEKDKLEKYYLTALINIGEKKYLEASNYVNRCFEINKNFILGHIASGIIYERQQNFKLAIKHFEKAIKIDQNNLVALRNLGIVFSHIGKIDKAIWFLKKSN